MYSRVLRCVANFKRLLRFEFILSKENQNRKNQEPLVSSANFVFLLRK